MKTINFNEIKVKALNGEDRLFDVREDFSNSLYFQARTLAAKELARKIYHSESDIELNEEEAKIALAHSKLYPIVVYEAIKELIN